MICGFREIEPGRLHWRACFIACQFDDRPERVVLGHADNDAGESVVEPDDALNGVDGKGGENDPENLVIETVVGS